MAGATEIPALDLDRTALFFDFDGTLVEIAPEPHLVRVDPSIIGALSLLQARTGGALAVVSGREIAQLDHYLAPLTLPAAGVHGIEIRHSDGKLHRAGADEAVLEKARLRIAGFVAENPGLIMETKHGSLALHFRRRPELEASCLALARWLETEGGVHVLQGKMVIEFKASPLTKGTAIATFMNEPPFRGRTAFFIGDDVTDEHGFLAVNRLGGISVKVGPGRTAARFRIPDVASLALWLARMSAPAEPAGIHEVAGR